MDENFYSSTEASQITGCSRRQLQYWREKSVVVPTVNPSGKGRNVYYSDSDLVALTVMEYLLSIGLSFEVCQHVLEIVKARESWMFDESVAKEEMKRLMLVPDSQSNCVSWWILTGVWQWRRLIGGRLLCRFGAISFINACERISKVMSDS
jgi:DNA-binding transcriptional MerR regulator